MVYSRILKGTTLILICALPFSVPALLQHDPGSPSTHMTHTADVTSPLTMPGNAVFGTIQEVIRELEADPNTDWSQVDLEALRQHLIDMHHFTINVEMLSKSNIDTGMKIIIAPTVPAAKQSLERVLDAHTHMLHRAIAQGKDPHNAMMNHGAHE
ncbi:MAG: hypothetical protein K9N46_09185 [Candidatus Marinimicrobia bacterium]|nr:hypothetical protein [Candidatus Neomarinimicrobiota bacterium]MCF7829412.1 hypothetical protein [Candidatus Neomarinimicrobiota bacterium]MCF7880898.1 hypothetical protein [Candidatus Neomarinimicrobiota bacterium]